MSRITDNVKKSSNKFSFISTFFDLVGNKEFKLAEVSTLYTTSETRDTSIWRSLSAVAEQLGLTFYDNTLNFIDNICNIDLCKVASLLSMISSIGVNFSIFNDIKFMPLDIRNAIDILSIKREYLTSYVKMDENFVKSMYVSSNFSDIGKIGNCIIDSLSSLSTAQLCSERISSIRTNMLCSNPDLSTYWQNPDINYSTAIDDIKFNSYISSVYYSILSSKITLTYNDLNCTFIYENLSSNILEKDFELPNDKIDEINSQKTLYNIPMTFNVLNEVDKYENGEVDLSDYSSQQQSLLSIEISRRKEPFLKDQLKTRYKFYKEREVKEYTDFILNEYSNTTISENYLSAKKYDLDNAYVLLHSGYSEETKKDYKLFFKDDYKRITYRKDMILIIANQLMKITIGIRELREQLKSLCLKNYMRGTKLFLQYIINEYIRSNIVQTLKDIDYIEDYNFDIDTTNVDLVEYADPTEYFNICCDTDVLLSSEILDELSTLNNLYWNNNKGLEAIGAIDSTNIFAKLPTLESLNFIFNESTMSAFYLMTLKNYFYDNTKNLSALTLHMHKFLQKLFELGADNTFLSDDIFHTYDSYTAKVEYDELSLHHHLGMLSVEDTYKDLSNNIPEKVDLNNTINEQVSLMHLAYYNAGNEILRLKTILLSTTLCSLNELSSEFRISSLITELSDKYILQEDVAYENYQTALSTDSFAKQAELDSLCAKTAYDYNKISASYSQASVYIPTDFKQQDLSLCLQLSNLCMSLSAIEDDDARELAISNVLSLATDISNANEMSSKIELESILDMLQIKYEDLLALKNNELTEIRNSDIFKYREQIFNQYIGKSIGNTPYYYNSNQRHPSYILHPFLSNYIEKEEYDYPIDNVTNIILESAAELIKNNIALYIDLNGYLINMWKNPLNSNADYLTRYEQEPHTTSSGKESELFSYDGLFYPKALNDFLTNKTYIGISSYDEDGQPLTYTATFIEALSGMEFKDTTYECINPWYSVFDMSKAEREHIAEQLSVFRNEIEILATDPEFDIYRYGIDIYKNSYILVKNYNGKQLDCIEKANANGKLWMRIKNHPIAFPAYAYSESTDEDLSVAQLQVLDGSNRLHRAFAMDKNGPIYDGKQICYPLVKDFTFSTDKNIIVINGQHNSNSTASYPIIAVVSQTYDDRSQIWLYFHNKVNPKSPILDLIDENALTADDKYAGWNFETYFSIDSSIGVLYSNISSYGSDPISNTIQIAGSYYNPNGQSKKLFTLKKTIVDEVESIEPLENVCIDVNDDIATVAYIDSYPTTSLSNYLDKTIDQDKVEECYNLSKYDFSIKTKKYKILKYYLLKYNYLNYGDGNTLSFLKYTDLGCFGLLGKLDGIDNGVNLLGDTYLGKYDIHERGIYKFQIMSDPILDKTSMIDFRFTMPVRRYESLNLKEYETVPGTKFKAMSYLDVHYYETLNDPTTSELSSYDVLSTDVHTYDPYSTQWMLHSKLPGMKIDEQQLDLVANVREDPYVRYPYLYYLSTGADGTVDRDIPSHFIYPYAQETVKPKDDNCFFKIYAQDAFPAISVSWCYYGNVEDGKFVDEGKIQIDFNTLYNKSSASPLSDNMFNYKHLFLNLEKRGDAGILKVYKDPLNGDFEEYGTFYIKNISDYKPKFLLSASTSVNESYNGFILDDDKGKISYDEVQLIAEGTIPTIIANEMTLVEK